MEPLQPDFAGLYDDVSGMESADFGFFRFAMGRLEK
jgi:hypothetical protein